MESTVVQITEVNSKQVNTKRGVGTVFEVKGSDGKSYSTFDSKLGQQAAQLRGQSAVLQFETVQKGEFTNHYLKGIEADEFVASAGPKEMVLNPYGQSNFLQPATDTKSQQINRSVAFKGATELVAAGVLTIDDVADLAKLTDKLIPIVDGTWQGEVVPFEKPENSGEGSDDLGLVKF
jgi:hypothetical protein